SVLSRRRHARGVRAPEGAVPRGDLDDRRGRRRASPSDAARVGARRPRHPVSRTRRAGRHAGALRGRRHLRQFVDRRQSALVGARGLRGGAARHLDRDRGHRRARPRRRDRPGGPAARFRALTPRHFFEGAVSDRTPRLAIDRMPDARDEAVAIAEAACRGRFDLLGYEALSFGDPIDWSLDPVAGRRAPVEHWSRLNPLDPSTIGDSKVVWELNRHQWMVQLGQAYRLTGDLCYARAFTDYLEQWIDANPPGVGINWASS